MSDPALQQRPLRRPGTLTLAVCLLSALLAGCRSGPFASSDVDADDDTTMRTRASHDPDVDIASWKTYGWLAPPPTGDPRLDNTPYRVKVQGAVDAALRAKGYTLADEPDFWLAYYPLVEETTSAEMRTTYETAPVTLDGWEELYPADCLLLDAVDADTAQLAWRGLVDDPQLDLLLGAGTFGERRLKAAARRLLEDFPPD
jgi:Domain of unknown function (DUF4136)